MKLVRNVGDGHIRLFQKPLRLLHAQTCKIFARKNNRRRIASMSSPAAELFTFETADYFRLSIASSNLIFEGMKSIFFTNSNAF